MGHILARVYLFESLFRLCPFDLDAANCIELYPPLTQTTSARSTGKASSGESLVSVSMELSEYGDVFGQMQLDGVMCIWS